MPVNVLNLPGLKILDFKETGHDHHIRAEPAATLKLRVNSMGSMGSPISLPPARE